MVEKKKEIEEQRIRKQGAPDKYFKKLRDKLQDTIDHKYMPDMLKALDKYKIKFGDLPPKFKHKDTIFRVWH